MKDYTSCEICDVSLKDTKELQPVFVSFPHGTLLAKEVSRLNCTVCRHKFSKKRHVAITTEEGNVYVGSRDTLDEQSLTSNVCNTFIAIRNRKTNKIRLVESDNIMLSRVVAKQNDLLIAKDANINETTRDVGNYSNLEKSFGSKLKKRQFEQTERYQTDVNTLRENLLEVVDTVDATQLVKSVVQMDSTLIPRCNRLASTVDNVYQLHDIISKLELESMEEKASKVLEDLSNLNTEDFTSFFLKNVHQVTESSNRQQFIQVLLYADCILKFFSKTHISNSSYTDACPFSQLIAKKLRKEFTLESSTHYRLRPKSMRDKAMCHIIVLSLLVMNFKLDLSTLVGSSIIPLKQLLILSRAVGTSSSTRDVTQVELKLPLPEIKVFSRKERG